MLYISLLCCRGSYHGASVIHTKGNNSREFLFNSLHNKIPSKNGSCLKGQNLLLEEQILFLEELTILRREAKLNMAELLSLKMYQSILYPVWFKRAGRHSTVGSASDSRARGPGFDTRSGHILSFLLPLIQEGQLSH